MDQSFQVPNLASLQPVIRGLKYYFDPVFINLDTLDLSRPALFVGNHTLYGLLDIPLFMNEIYQQHGIYLRSLGDHAHFLLPGWHQLLERAGMVDGTPENCAELMEKGESILVFPGGSREVMRRKGDDYQLFWKQRTGFVRMAIEHGYDIIPFASVGANECFDIYLDANDVMNTPWVSAVIQKLSLSQRLRQGDVLAPMAKGLFGLPIPKPQRFYFSFGDRISSKKYTLDVESQMNFRQQVEHSIYHQMTTLQQIRSDEKDKKWSWIRRKLT